jgi:dTDP-4-amino-4,6-dideoxygalactose transaminase
MMIPLVDLKAQYKMIRDEIDAAIQGVINRNAFVGSDAVRQFEEEFSAYCGIKARVGVGNGTDAL